MIRAISYRQSSLGIYSDINFIDSYFLGIYYALGVGFPVGAVVKNPPGNAGDIRDAGSIPGLERFPWRRKWQPTPVFLLGNPMDRGAWWATVHGVTKELDKTD